MQRTIKFDRIPGSKKLFLDYLSGKAAEFYRYPFTDQESFASVQRELNRRSFPREQIVAALLRQNRQYNASPKTVENINKLLDPATTAVFTGQQVTLFGGSLLTFYKASLAVKLAASNCARLNTPVVPIFWLAADDDDFAEVATVALPSKGDKIVELTYRPHHIFEGQSMGSVRLDDGILTLLDEYEQTLPESEFRSGLVTKLREFYQPGESIVTAFARYLSYVFADKGLILVDPSDEEFRRLAAPVFKRELSLREKAAQLVEQNNQSLEAQGYHLQVAKPGTFANLYFHQGKRSRINFAPGGFEVEAESYSQATLEHLVDENPSLFSPNVFLRAIVQSHIFPTLTYFAGPAEVAYFAQISGMFDLFGEVAPIIYPRFSATVVESNVERLMAKYDLNYEDFSGDVGQLATEVLKRSFPSDLVDQFRAFRENVASKLDAITKQLDQGDHSVMTNASRIAGRIDLEIKTLEEKAFQSHKKKNQTARAQLERVGFHLFPARKLQERVFPLNYYIAKYGMQIVDRLYDATDCNSSVHHLIYLNEPEEKNL